MESLGSSLVHNLDTVVFTLLCGDTCQIDRALALVRSLGPLYEQKHPKVFERTIHKLGTLCDIKLLFEACLRCNDLDLALVLVERFPEVSIRFSSLNLLIFAKRKPEYLKFLRSLGCLDDRCRKFTIYKFLGNHKAALDLLDVSTSDGFEEYVLYTESESVYQLAMDRHELTDTQSKRILLGYGNYLFKEQSYYAAGISLSLFP